MNDGMTTKLLWSGALVLAIVIVRTILRGAAVLAGSRHSCGI